MKQVKSRDASPVRMRLADKNYVEELAREMNETQTEILHRAVELLRRERQFQDMREAYMQLSESELKEMHSESRLLDTASSDGIA